jgi:acetyl-CoA carboxylase biotin carboxylase subunit
VPVKKGKIKKVLVANRGEIALRIIRTCKEMGIRTVAVYSEADRSSLHVHHADEAFLIGPAPPRESYLSIDRIIEVAKRSRCDALHPGYGFLSENPEFARKTEQASIIFIGPSAFSIAAMGDKLEARARVKGAGVPVVPGSTKPLKSSSAAAKEADQIGYPLLLKAAGGGGGKGMRIVLNSRELKGAFEAAQREARAAFSDQRIYIERYLASPHHIEVQVLFDKHGNGIHLGERECSIQRRFQKIIEESPSPFVDEKLRQEITAAALSAAKSCGYFNAGTVEFLVDRGGNFYFLEMNTRLQVEHPVTEMRTGIDIVEEQIRIASGERLRFKQGDVSPRGHAIECRIYAEDPESNFMPSVGQIHCLRSPQGNGVRVDGGIEENTEITYFYDPLISKLVCWGMDRNQAVNRTIRALSEYIIGGVKTTIPFCLSVLKHSAFRSGTYDTHFVSQLLNEKSRVNYLPLAELGLAISSVLATREHQFPEYLSQHENNGANRIGWKARRFELIRE